MSPADMFQQQINANVAAQADLLASHAPDKLVRLRALQEQQRALFTARDRARLHAAGLALADAPTSCPPAHA